MRPFAGAGTGLTCRRITLPDRRNLRIRDGQGQTPRVGPNDVKTTERIIRQQITNHRFLYSQQLALARVLLHNRRTLPNGIIKN